jgi:xanthine dehydrogenase YagS FAD-binding subunit
MDDFSYARPSDVATALQWAAQPGAQFIAGGTNLVDLMKGGVAGPSRLIDITHLGGLARIHELPGGGVRIGALATNAETAAHPLIRQRYPLLSQAILAGASPQLRNMATNGGNLLQRTRCPYFYDTGFDRCNKRQPGSGCAALEGFNRNHAILGASEHCIATHPSDMCVALAALDAEVHVRSARGSRQVPLKDFHRLPGDTPQRDTNLGAGEIITALDLPANRFAEHSHYLKVRDRASYAFALVSVAAALSLDDNVIQDVRVVLGGVAHKPWPLPDAQPMLIGKPLEPEILKSFAAAALREAKPQSGNAFKIELSRRAIVRALNLAAAENGATSWA